MRHSKGFDGAPYIFLVCFQQQVYMIGHEAVGIECTERWLMITDVVILLQHLLQTGEHAHIVFLVFKDILSILASLR